MTARDLNKVRPGDRIKIKKGTTNAGCYATFIRFRPTHRGGVHWIEYEFAGQREIAPHIQFTLDK